MDKQSLFVQVANLEARIGELYEELGSLKHQIQELIEENQRLQRENEHYQALMMGKGLPESGSAQENLRRIYREGFHICNVKYGSLRTDGECLFCLAFIERA
ncbi:initiation-control protein YabA [Alicyclobacillus vulcanalis]|uniref:Regulator of replication initiation timing n=1 Tax=Alicyclobacillus vulcanalis TaxID=252246 RepID=A0A1N7MFU1_9BACL|nr:DNA replication initiation control protein YabA [Alicyclobacillus vulcanalis]SIS85006.1 Regulator of replication initiation timing [Alicyclobacillus vulcanalis]